MQFTEQQPIYMQIADVFCENILSGIWKPNDRIPSVRDVAVSMEVNPNTAMRSFEFLQSKEIIFNKRGIGYFVSEEGHDKALAYKREEFMNKTVPEFFRNMYLLGIKYEEMKLFYEKSIR